MKELLTLKNFKEYQKQPLRDALPKEFLILTTNHRKSGADSGLVKLVEMTNFFF